MCIRDRFTYDNGGYYNMETRDGCGRPIALTHPEGMISWLYQFASDYDGTPSQGSGSYRVRSLCEELGDVYKRQAKQRLPLSDRIIYVIV